MQAYFGLTFNIFSLLYSGMNSAEVIIDEYFSFSLVATLEVVTPSYITSEIKTPFLFDNFTQITQIRRSSALCST